MTTSTGDISNKVLCNNGKRNKIGIVSSDVELYNVFAEALTRMGFTPASLNLEKIVNGTPQNFYLVDLLGLDNYSRVIQSIKLIREKVPDSEIILLQTPFTLSRPQAQPLKVAVERYLVPVYQRPLKEDAHAEVLDYKQGLQQFVDTTLGEHIRRFLSQPHVIKVGGSIFDLFDRNPEVLMSLLEEVKKLYNEGYPIILTTGGGPRQITERELSEALGTSPASRKVLESQVSTIIQLLGNVGSYVPPSKVRDYLVSGDFVGKYIPVVSLSGITQIPAAESDTHTLALGDRLKSHKIVFAKDTDGVYARDPYKQPRRRRFSMPWTVVEDNPFYPAIHASQILNGEINRVGADGKSEHLIETGALIYLKGKTQHVRAVQIINGTKPDLLRRALDGIFVGSYILRG